MKASNYCVHVSTWCTDAGVSFHACERLFLSFDYKGERRNKCPVAKQNGLSLSLLAVPPPVNTVITFQTLTVKLQEKEAGGGQTLL